MAVWIYTPAVWIEHVTGLAAETVFVALVLGAGAASALAFVRLAGLGADWRWLVLAVVLLVPLSAFAEREQMAVILMLPILGLAIRRARGENVTLWLALVCGMLAGMAPMIKPHFALGLAGAYIAVAVLRRDGKMVLSPEIVLTAVLAVAYAAGVYAFMPAYSHDVMPLLLDVYRPMRKPLWQVLTSSQIVTWTMSVGALWWLRRFDAYVWVLLAASFGFMLGFIDQGRGWAYHALPMITTLMLAVTVPAWPIAAGGEPERRMTAVVALFAAAVNLAGFSVFTYPAQGVVPTLQAMLKHPTVMGITADQAPGHPIASRIHGTWVGTYSSRWITANSRVLYSAANADRQARLVKWMVLDRQVTNADLAKRPDVVLVGLGPYDWKTWIAADPETARLMSGYVLVATDAMTPQKRKTYEGIEAWVRSDLVK